MMTLVDMREPKGGSHVSFEGEISEFNSDGNFDQCRDAQLECGSESAQGRQQSR
jgi:hypothetical protein